MTLNTAADYIYTPEQVDALEDITEELQSLADKGEDVTLRAGAFRVSRTIKLPDNCHLRGADNMGTTLVLGNAVNNNMFTNAGYGKNDVRNSNIRLSNLRLNGNLQAQFKPETEKRLSFCNILYFANSDQCEFDKLFVLNVLQTALHFRHCTKITIKKLYAEHLGWSGISTSGTSEIVATDFNILDSGNDHRHSAIHLDGGKGAYLRGDIRKCVGNGIMLDATFGPFSHALVEVNASECMRGISLIGSGDVQVHTVLMKNCNAKGNDVGIMVSNACNAFISNCNLMDNREYGVLFQGRFGGRDSFVTNCTFKKNGTDIKEIHQSGGNTFLENNKGSMMEDVLFGRENTMFLVTSVHNIYDHITNKIEIPKESIVNFGKNIKSRAKWCEDRGIAYKHVIYPDKTTVMKSYLPIDHTRSFSDRYKEHFDHNVVNLENYLPDSKEHFLRTDTHLNFNGKVETTLAIMKQYHKFDESEAREQLLKCRGEEYEMLGDLGSKITPQQKETHYRVINKNTKTFNNQVGANDGLTAITFNLEKIRNKQIKRLLIFGDSFAERSLKLFANFYSEILFCRTRYFHEEIAFMYRPDDIMTESAERYFSYVRLDKTAARFNLLYGLRGSKYSEDIKFYEAYNAVLNYGSETYSIFIRRLFEESIN